MQWVRTAIPEFNKLIMPLHDLLESIYVTTSAYTKRANRRIQVAYHGWNPLFQKCFDYFKCSLLQQVTLSHRDPSQPLYVFTDVLDRFWSIIVTQIKHCDKQKRFHTQHHSPLAFLVGRFGASQLSWLILEKAA